VNPKATQHVGMTAQLSIIPQSPVPEKAEDLFAHGDNFEYLQDLLLSTVAV
jgi:hypothetical protein